MYKDVSGNVTPMALGTVPKHKKGVPKSISIDDRTSGNKTIIFHDVFTPDASNGVASPTAQTKTWLMLETNGGPVNINLDKEALTGITLFGAIDVSSNISDASMNIGVNIEYE